jgi:hypothetical protein
MTRSGALKVVPLVLCLGRTLGLLALAVTALGVSAAPSSARGNFERHLFRVTLRVDQTTNWQEAHVAQGLNCTQTIDGAGQQSITFSTGSAVFALDYGDPDFRSRRWNISPASQRLQGQSTWTRTGHHVFTDTCYPPASQTSRTDGCGVERFATSTLVSLTRRYAAFGLLLTPGVEGGRVPFTDPSSVEQTCPYPGTAPRQLPGIDGGFGYLYVFPVAPATLRNVRQRRIVLRHDINDTFTAHESGFADVTARTTGGATLTLVRVPNELRVEEVAATPVPVLYRGVFRARLFPPWATARSFTWQLRRSNQSQWTTLGRTPQPSFPFTVRLAGHFKMRAIAHGATSGGPPRTVYTRERPLEVTFPTRDQILTDQDVNSFTQDAWARTLRLATPESRREVGFWISLDTCSIPRGHQRYAHTRTILGPPVGPDDENNSVRLGPRPADDPRNPPAVIGCATYMVASFHTHPPTTYQRGAGPNPADGRGVGPSPEDERVDREDMVPGVVFDYIANPPGSESIPFGYPKESPAQRYRSGFVRRPTPR